MAGTNWTKQQLEAINASGCNILVSAAAGSGKTAVLVERVIRMITRKEDPLDIDELVIMTFTRAAAAQMKSKIYQAIKQKLQEEGEDERLRSQLMKVQSARICTIDSLCADIVRENIQDTDLDPNFRIADEAQLAILKRNTLSILLEECYEEADESFLDFVQYYTDKNDSKLEDIILTLYAFSQSHPEPYPWLRSVAYPYLEAQDMSSGEGYVYPDGSKNWLEEFGKIIQSRLAQIRTMAVRGIKLSRMNGGPWQYEDLFTAIAEFVDSLQDQSFDYMVYSLREYLEAWPKLPSISSKDASVETGRKEAAQELRKEIKKCLEDLRDNFLYDDLENIYAQMAACAPVAKAISDLSIRFSEAFDEAKKLAGVADFSDVAHNALKVLIRYDDRGTIERDAIGHPFYTKAADQLAGSIRQVIVDEYQDTNMLQEYLVNAISGERFGRPDVFLVGDVKQSIYGFRMACPELFNEKMADYAAGRLIILDRNFRSRKEVLDITNLVFSQAMIPEVGGIDYQNGGHALVYSGIYGDTDPEKAGCYPAQENLLRNSENTPQGGSLRNFTPELLFVAGSGEQAKYMEGYVIADRIECLLNKEGYSPADICILTRTADHPQMEKVLSERGIPVVKTSTQGFFSSLEVRLSLNLLRIIDNPYQDIPFAAVLHSPLLNCDAQELAEIRLSGKEHDSLYKCFVAYNAASGHSYDSFLEKLSFWQEAAGYMGLYDLLEYVLEDSGLEAIVTAMPQGAERRANVEMLKAKAAEYAKGTYAGIFEFLQYIKELEKAGIDYGSCTSSDAAAAVSMMTIHKSKGLEFPVVIVACCGKKYNEMDLNTSIISDRSLGAGIEFRDPSTRMIKKTAFMQAIRHAKRIDTYAEEMRLLYVAMTRAKEKLILTGSDRMLSSRINTWEQAASFDQRRLEPHEVMRAGSFLSLLGGTLHKYKEAGKGFLLTYLDELEVQEQRAQEVLEETRIKQELLVKARCGESTQIAQQLNYQYPYLKAAHMMGKITASQLENTQIQGIDYLTASSDADIDGFLDTDRLRGTQRGNAYHRFLELMDYSRDIDAQLEAFVRQGLMDVPSAHTIERERILAFLDSPLGIRMAKAHACGRLFREQQFVMGYEEDVNSAQTRTGMNFHSDAVDEELLLVQGIIDAYFLETDHEGRQQIVLVDYKTDRVLEEAYYREKYSPQLGAYADALERRYHTKVSEQFIYSLELGREIKL